ncbi:MAG: hypothetical protein ACRD6B_00870 [Bryobacteraceae bacterium]
MSARTTRSEKLDLRLTRNAKRVLQAAAATSVSLALWAMQSLVTTR